MEDKNIMSIYLIVKENTAEKKEICLTNTRITLSCVYLEENVSLPFI